MSDYDKHQNLALFLKDYLGYTQARLAQERFLEQAKLRYAHARDAADVETTFAIESIIRHVWPGGSNGNGHAPTAPAPRKSEPGPQDYASMPIAQRFAGCVSAKAAGSVVGIGRDNFLSRYCDFKEEGHLTYTKSPEQVVIFDIARLTFAYCQERFAVQTLRGMGLSSRTLEGLDDELLIIESDMQDYFTR